MADSSPQCMQAEEQSADALSERSRPASKRARKKRPSCRLLLRPPRC